MPEAIAPDRPLGSAATDTRRRTSVALVLGYLGLATMGFNSVRVGSLALSDFCFLACGVVIAAKLLTGGERGLATAEMRRNSPLVLVGSILLLTAGTVSSFGSWDGFGSAQVVLRFVWLTFVWFWLLRTVARDRTALAVLAKGWRLGVLISAVIGVLGEFGVVQLGAQNSEGRQTGFFGQPNEFAALVAIGVPLLILDTPAADGGYVARRPLAVRLGLAGLAVVGIFTSGSMTATISCVAGVMAALVFLLASGASRAGARRQRNPVVGIVLAVCVAGGIFTLATSDLPVVERFTRLQEGDSYVEASVETRDQRNEEAIQRLPNTLLLGTGLQLPEGAVARVGTAASTDPDAVESIHNMYLKIAHEAGFPALVGLLVVMGASVNQLWRLARNTLGTGLDRFAAALFGAFGAAATQAMFSPIVYQRYFWITIAMIGCLWSVRRQELRDRAAASADVGGQLAGAEPGRGLEPGVAP